MEEVSGHFAHGRSHLKLAVLGTLVEGRERVLPSEALPRATPGPGVAFTCGPLHGKEGIHKEKRREGCQTWA